ncbi:hypothetical protein EDEG_04076 [Edhazardia aedis USNM 41457]|uniref:KIF-binding protein n=1 Tax=Edhazardia aedis (strain USNM 41457) TaxID=1003232 RepID=J9DCY4_EDHAE|nr:hypothetical protein EDEG_04076 [Edhazardia aedis USNM 41457]|eukprot:EJW05334.1 hypothetical protein EDEG_04076 [Edhazardia aedis USNM 41457]
MFFKIFIQNIPLLLASNVGENANSMVILEVEDNWENYDENYSRYIKSPKGLFFLLEKNISVLLGNLTKENSLTSFSKFYCKEFYSDIEKSGIHTFFEPKIKAIFEEMIIVLSNIDFFIRTINELKRLMEYGLKFEMLDYGFYTEKLKAGKELLSRCLPFLEKIQKTYDNYECILNLCEVFIFLEYTKEHFYYPRYQFNSRTWMTMNIKTHRFEVLVQIKKQINSHISDRKKLGMVRREDIDDVSKKFEETKCMVIFNFMNQDRNHKINVAEKMTPEEIKEPGEILMQSRCVKTKKEAIEKCLLLYKIGISSLEACKYWLDEFEGDDEKRNEKENHIYNTYCIALNAQEILFQLGHALEKMRKDSSIEQILIKNKCICVECDCTNKETCLKIKCQRCNSSRSDYSTCVNCYSKLCEFLDEEKENKRSYKIMNFVHFNKLSEYVHLNGWITNLKSQSDKFYKVNCELVISLEKLIAKDIDINLKKVQRYFDNPFNTKDKSNIDAKLDFLSQFDYANQAMKYMLVPIILVSNTERSESVELCKSTIEKIIELIKILKTGYTIYNDELTKIQQKYEEILEKKDFEELIRFTDEEILIELIEEIKKPILEEKKALNSINKILEIYNRTSLDKLDIACLTAKNVLEEQINAILQYEKTKANDMYLDTLKKILFEINNENNYTVPELYVTNAFFDQYVIFLKISKCIFEGIHYARKISKIIYENKHKLDQVYKNFYIMLDPVTNSGVPFDISEKGIEVLNQTRHCIYIQENTKNFCLSHKIYHTYSRPYYIASYAARSLVCAHKLILMSQVTTRGAENLNKHRIELLDSLLKSQIHLENKCYNSNSDQNNSAILIINTLKKIIQIISALKLKEADFQKLNSDISCSLPTHRYKKISEKYSNLICIPETEFIDLLKRFLIAGEILESIYSIDPFLDFTDDKSSEGRIAVDAKIIFSESYLKLRKLKITDEVRKKVDEHYEKAKNLYDEAYKNFENESKERPVEAKKTLEKKTDDFLIAFMIKKFVFTIYNIQKKRSICNYNLYDLYIRSCNVLIASKSSECSNCTNYLNKRKRIGKIIANVIQSYLLQVEQEELEEDNISQCRCQ